MAPKRKYDSSYFKYGITEIEVNREIRSQCVICIVVFSNNALLKTEFEYSLSFHQRLVN